MLVLTRKVGEKIIIEGGIEISIERILSAHEGNSVRIGIKAPKNIKILRAELADQEEFFNDPAGPKRLAPVG